MSSVEKYILSLIDGNPPIRIVYESGDGGGRRWHWRSSRYPGEGNRKDRRTAAKGKARK